MIPQLGCSVTLPVWNEKNKARRKKDKANCGFVTGAYIDVRDCHKT